MKKPFTSVIIPTKNEEKNIENCLKSVKSQTYKNIEIIVVDNNSKDNTKKIAQQYTKKVFNKGPERSAQRNFGAEKANGKYLLFIDADMILTKKVIDESVRLAEKNKEIGGIIIPEKSIGEGFWAKCKALEKEFYEGVDWIEAARFFSKKAFEDIGGYDDELISAEDWDLSQRVVNKYKIGRVNNFILHNEGRLSLRKVVKKKYYYSQKFSKYIKKNHATITLVQQTSLISRYKLFFKNYKKLLHKPIIGLGMISMKSSEFAAGSLGYLLHKITSHEKYSQ